MTSQAFTIRPNIETAKSINELAKLLGVTKNKLLIAILESSKQDMDEMIAHLKSLDIPLHSPYFRIHSDLKRVILDAAEAERDDVERKKNIVTFPSIPNDERNDIPTYLSHFLE